MPMLRSAIADARRARAMMLPIRLFDYDFALLPRAMPIYADVIRRYARARHVLRRRLFQRVYRCGTCADADIRHMRHADMLITPRAA